MGELPAWGIVKPNDIQCISQKKYEGSNEPNRG